MRPALSSGSVPTPNELRATRLLSRAPNHNAAPSPAAYFCFARIYFGTSSGAAGAGSWRLASHLPTITTIATLIRPAMTSKLKVPR